MSAYFKVAIAVPIQELILFVAIAVCTGKPANMYAGRDMRPPPPAMASIKPAMNTSGQTIRYFNTCGFSRLNKIYTVKLLKTKKALSSRICLIAVELGPL